MNKWSSFLGVTVFFIFTFSLASPSFADPNPWPSNSGILCWEVINGGNPGFVEMAVKRTVGSHYVVSGTNTEEVEEGVYVKTLFNGNAVVIDDGIMMNISSAGYMADDRHGFIGVLELDQELYGTLRGLEINAVYPQPVVPDYKVQSATDKRLELVPCD